MEDLKCLLIILMFCLHIGFDMKVKLLFFVALIITISCCCPLPNNDFIMDMSSVNFQQAAELKLDVYANDLSNLDYNSYLAYLSEHLL